MFKIRHQLWSQPGQLFLWRRRQMWTQITAAMMENMLRKQQYGVFIHTLLFPGCWIWENKHWRCLMWNIKWLWDTNSNKKETSDEPKVCFPAASLSVGLQIDVVENAAPEVPSLHRPPQSCSPPSSSDNGGRRGSDGVQGREYLFRKPCVLSVGVSGSSPLYTSGWSRFYLFKNRFCESGMMSDGRLELVWRALSGFLSCFKAFHQREYRADWSALGRGFLGGLVVLSKSFLNRVSGLRRSWPGRRRRCGSRRRIWWSRRRVWPPPGGSPFPTSSRRPLWHTRPVCPPDCRPLHRALAPPSRCRLQTRTQRKGQLYLSSLQNLITRRLIEY